MISVKKLFYFYYFLSETKVFLESLSKNVNNDKQFLKLKEHLKTTLDAGRINATDVNGIIAEREKRFKKMETILPVLEAWLDQNTPDSENEIIV